MTLKQEYVEKVAIQHDIPLEDLELDPKLEEDDPKLCFIFIVDRSGSMSSGQRMPMTVKAMQLFM
jgi:Mg-chelatase subunit ChlD